MLTIQEPYGAMLTLPTTAAARTCTPAPGSPTTPGLIKHAPPLLGISVGTLDMATNQLSGLEDMASNNAKHLSGLNYQ